MSLLLTLVQNLRAAYPSQVDKNERRLSQYGVWEFFQQQAAIPGSIMTPQIKKLISQSFGKTIQVPVLDAQDVTIGTTRTCTVAADENSSKLVTLTFVPYSFGFTMYPAQHYNNEIDYNADFNAKMRKYLLKFAATLDTAGRNVLETNRNQYFPADIDAYFPDVANALQVPQASKNDFFNQFQAVLETMDFYDTPHIVGSTSLNPIIRRDMAQGAGNSTNQNFQFDPYVWHTSNRVTNAAGVEATVYGVVDGNVAAYNRNTPEALGNYTTGNGKEWGTAVLPIVNLEMGTFFYDDCADISALHAGTVNNTRSKMEAFAFDTEICYMTSYNSDPTTRYTPIVKAEIAA